jgi:uncharacterized SAM-binding protein YcdF (DUF218 family)
MDHLFLYCIAGGIALVFIFCLTRIAFRWIIRLTVVGLLLLAVIGGVTWLWWSRSSADTPKPRPPSVTKRAGTDRQ